MRFSDEDDNIFLQSGRARNAFGKLFTETEAGEIIFRPNPDLPGVIITEAEYQRALRRHSAMHIASMTVFWIAMLGAGAYGTVQFLQASDFTLFIVPIVAVVVLYLASQVYLTIALTRPLNSLLLRAQRQWTEIHNPYGDPAIQPPELLPHPDPRSPAARYRVPPS